MPSVEIDDLAEQGDLLDAAIREDACLLDDLGDRAAALGTTGRRHDAEGAVHVAPLHDRDEGCSGFLRGGKMFPDGVLGSLLGGDVDDGGDRRAEFGLILPRERLLPPSKGLLHMVGHHVELLGPHHKIDMWGAVSEVRAEALGHASHVAEDELRLLAS